MPESDRIAQLQQALDEEKRNSTLRNELWSASFIGQTSYEIKMQLLRMVGEALHVENTSFISLEGGDKIECVWRSDGISAGLNDTIPYLLVKYLTGRDYLVFSINDIPAFASKLLHPFIKKYDIKSVLVVPFGAADHPEGFVIASVYDKVRDFSSADIQLMKEVSQIIHIRSSQLREQSQTHLFGKIAAQFDDAIIITDPQFTISYLNQAAENLFGCTLNDLKGESPVILSADPDREQIQISIYNELKEKGEVRRLMTNFRKSGSLFTCSFL